MSLTVTTTTTTTVELKPALKTKLLKRLTTYAGIRAQVKALEEKLDAEKAAIGLLREEAGVNSLEIDGFHVTLISGTRAALSKQKLIGMGITLDMIEECTEHKPNRPYTKVTCPGEKSYSD